MTRVEVCALEIIGVLGICLMPLESDVGTFRRTHRTSTGAG